MRKELLYGKDPTPRIVGIVPLLHEEQAAMRVIMRGDSLSQETVDFFPFFFVADMDVLRLLSRDDYMWVQLEGSHFYRHLVAFRSWDKYKRALERVKRGLRRSYYSISNPVHQYLLQSGRTFFKGMTYADVLRMQLDIETYRHGGFPDADVDPIIVISTSTSTGVYRIFHTAVAEVEHGVSCLGEADMLRAFLDHVDECDPDVLETFNGFSYDLPYLQRRCEVHGIPFTLGRDRSRVWSYPSRVRFAERMMEFDHAVIAGRHHIDVYFSVLFYDMVKRTLSRHDLKSVAEHFGHARQGRVYLDGARIAEAWDRDPSSVLAYALDDVIETGKISATIDGSTFYLTQMVPMTYQGLHLSGSGAVIESLFVREYLRQRHSLPASEGSADFVGGYADVFITGVVGPVVYADVESLYPSIMLNYDIRPPKDTLGLFTELLQHLTTARLQWKAMLKTTVGEERRQYDAMQQAVKIIINSFFGYLGWAEAGFGDVDQASLVTIKGRELLRSAISMIDEEGGRVIEVDTDGIYFIPPVAVNDEGKERAFVEAISERMPAGIRLGYDGRFRAMVSYKKKNYALLDYEGNVRYKGSSLVARSMERFGRRFVQRGIRLLLEGDVQGLHDLYNETRLRILDGLPVEDLMRTETVTMSQDEYVRTKRGKQQLAAYEVLLSKSEKPFRKGARVSYYISNAGDKNYEAARAVDDFTAGDVRTSYYLDRLDAFCKIFGVFFDDYEFRQIFGEPDMFGFSPKNIHILKSERPVSGGPEPPF